MTDFEKMEYEKALESLQFLNENSGRCFKHELCKKCGGRCCAYPCGFTPDQMKTQPITYESLSELLKEGLYSLDYWYEDRTDSRWYYIRMRAVGAPVADEALNHHPCVMLTPEGCKFSDDERPNQGRYLIPISIEHCEEGLGKRNMGALWLPYNDILSRLWDEYAEIEKPEKWGSLDAIFAACVMGDNS